MHRNDHGSWSWHVMVVIITGPTKAPVMAKSQNKTEVRPNEITLQQYHTS